MSKLSKTAFAAAACALTAVAAAPAMANAPMVGNYHNPADDCVWQEISSEYDKAATKGAEEIHLGEKDLAQLTAKCEGKTGTEVEVFKGLIDFRLKVTSPNLFR